MKYYNSCRGCSEGSSSGPVGITDSELVSWASWVICPRNPPCRPGHTSGLWKHSCETQRTHRLLGLWSKDNIEVSLRNPRTSGIEITTIRGHCIKSPFLLWNARSICYHSLPRLYLLLNHSWTSSLGWHQQQLDHVTGGRSGSVSLHTLLSMRERSFCCRITVCGDERAFVLRGFCSDRFDSCFRMNVTISLKFSSRRMTIPCSSVEPMPSTLPAETTR